MGLVFAIIALLTISSALAVILFRNPLKSALALIFHMLMVSGLFALLNAHFLAAVQIIVYAGAIMVLVLFVVMLLNIKVENPKPIGKIYLGIGVLSALGFLVIIIPLLRVLFVEIPDPVLPLAGGAKEIGRILYTQYLFPFEIASVLLFVAIAGAVMVAKRSYKSADKIADTAKESL